MDSERPDLDAFAGANLDQLGIVQQTVLFQLVLHVSKRELGAVDRNVEFSENPGQRPDVIFVAVGEHDGADLLAVLDAGR